MLSCSNGIYILYIYIWTFWTRIDSKMLWDTFYSLSKKWYTESTSWGTGPVLPEQSAVPAESKASKEIPNPPPKTVQASSRVNHELHPLSMFSMISSPWLQLVESLLALDWQQNVKTAEGTAKWNLKMNWFDKLTWTMWTLAETRLKTNSTAESVPSAHSAKASCTPAQSSALKKKHWYKQGLILFVTST